MNRNFNGKHLLFEIKKISKKKTIKDGPKRERNDFTVVKLRKWGFIILNASNEIYSILTLIL